MKYSIYLYLIILNNLEPIYYKNNLNKINKFPKIFQTYKKTLFTKGIQSSFLS